jgi:N-acetylglucosamine-6-sulfatase
MRHKTRAQIILTFVILIAIMAETSCSSLEALGIVHNKPNVIFILTDDMDFPLVPYMKNMNELIAQQGATFTNYYVTAPLCCPSRASTFRGQYPHNTNILENAPGYKNYFRNGREAESIAVWLSRAGYKTALMGKYLNGYPIEAGESYVPPGWTDWHAYFHHDPEDDEGGYYFDYQMNENGKVVQYGSAPEDYSTDVIKRDSIKFINNSISSHDPFFIYISLTAPHGPSIPAPRHAGLLSNIEYPQKPSFLTPDITPKPAIVMEKATVPGEEFDVYDANQFFRNRAETLLAVDEMVQEIVQTLEQSGQLDNTYIIFTSDNGFHMGEHNFSGGKALPYIEDVNVPFFIRGPGIQPGITIHQMTANIDVAPTILDMAGGKTADFVDGRSMMPLWGSGDTSGWRKGLLIEAGYTNRDSKALIFRSVRTETTFYVEFYDGAVEYYDLAADPYERDNIVGSLDAGTLSNLHTWLDKLKTCAADTCRQAEMEEPVVNH